MLKLFLTGFMQVFLVVLNTYFIANGYFIGLVVCGFLISYIWSHNVKKVAFGTEKERIIYAFGAMSGSIAGYILGKIILNH